MKKRIKVTRLDITNGKRRNSGQCPVALAMKRVCPPRCEMSVCRRNLTVWKTGIVTRVKTPLKVRLFIWLFDHGWPVPPFTFNLSINT